MQVKMGFVCVSLAMLLFSGGLHGQDASTTLSKADIEKIVHEYILAHPEVLMESVQGQRERERLETQRRSKDAVAANRRDLFNDSASPVIGAANAEVTIVQFFDYKCGYCRRVLPTLSTLLEKHRNVRMVYKELPILGADSQMASRAALAAQKQGAYLPFHRELMNLSGPITIEAIADTGKKVGLDVARLRSDMNAMEVDSALAQNQRLASAIGVQSTPSFVIGGELISGAMDLAGFEELIAKSRKH
jgi:protein-disulfide isomerase